MRLESRLLFGRLLTRSGDQAWDFSLPIVLLYTFPNHLRVAALFYFLLKLIHVIWMPRIAMVIDSWNRFSVVKFGLILQFFGVLITASPIGYWSLVGTPEPVLSDHIFVLSFVVLLGGGVLGSLGASLMDIAVANDLAPTVIPQDRLAQFNSRFRQVDLFTEVTSPVLAGLALTLTSGFFLVAIWNLVSFIPEFLILRSIFRERSDLRNKTAAISEQSKVSLFQKLTLGWRAFIKEPIAIVMVAYSFLWLSALSPHGVLLTGFLKDGWQIEEWKIGIFRGGGAIFGLIATLLFPPFAARIGVKYTSFGFLLLQAVCVFVAGLLFIHGSTLSKDLFLVSILLSRIGLYGFSLGEMQIRQLGIALERRGLINGVASSLNGLATLTLLGAGALLSSTDEFGILVFMSVLSVLIALAVYVVALARGIKAL